MDRRLFLLGALALAGCASSGPATLRPNTTLYILRHGDRDGENLSDRGRARARALVGALADDPVDAIHSPGIQRNLDTAAPLAAARGLTVQRRPQENPGTRLAAEAAGRSVVWVGNKGNLQAIWDTLSLPGDPPLDYGQLFVVRSGSDGAVTVERRFFGPQ
ncbi:histidine phosphatase family protein [Thalassococcus sp. CAU 1522]|uniref:Histidine phosphatase family protein n=1 Tax=Thalassococcus arenae TaxID=2851652 RepID=A0ABS6N3D0_9RHOB|nr:histidine phosphatase family protein [Thalassococcus arenae]MBV2358521.1 histidine phosphatase family protein [Thalassococcus arenae]